MDKDQLSELLGGWEGYTLGTIGRGPQKQQRGETPEIWIELHPDPQHPRVCSGCGQTVFAIHDTSERWVRDLPILEAETWLLVHRVRVNCPDCGPRIERLSWLDRFARFSVPHSTTELVAAESRFALRSRRRSPASTVRCTGTTGP